MKRIDLEIVEHNFNIGDIPTNLKPNINQDTLFFYQNKCVGFYIDNLPAKVCSILDITNQEFRSNNVPKSSMGRTSGVAQYSALLGAMAPRPHMRRHYFTMSQIHSVNSAKIFIQSMLMLVNYGENLLKEIMPNQYLAQKELLTKTDSKWRFSDLFTSSISNFNIAAAYHRDTGNLKNTVNLIFTRRHNSIGGCLNVPDFNIIIKQSNNSLLAYPAWQNVHGVTPILPINNANNFYRNSFIFYPLSAFENKSI